MAAILLLLGLAFLFSNPVRAQSTTSKNPNSTLWKVSGNGLAQPSYLFGTYQLVKSGYLPEEGKVLKAFRSAKGVAVEMTVDSSQLGLVAGYSVMQGNLLSRLLTEDEYKLVDGEVQSLIRQPLETMDQLKPINVLFFLVLTYSNAVAPDMLQYDGVALDAYFANEGKAAGKIVHSFETMTEQMDLFYNSVPLEKQAENLVRFVKDKKSVVKNFEEMIDLYKKENINGIDKIAEQMATFYGGVEFLRGQRNANWMKSLPGLMAERSMFVAVSVGHLPGDQGLIKLLQKRGYTVEPVH